MDPSRRTDGVHPVAQVASELAVDRRHREREQVVTPLGIETVDGAEEGDGADLLQVLERSPRPLYRCASADTSGRWSSTRRARAPPVAEIPIGPQALPTLLVNV